MAFYFAFIWELPSEDELDEFRLLLAEKQTTDEFVRDVIMKAPSADIMNNLSRSLLTLACYDEKRDDEYRES